MKKIILLLILALTLIPTFAFASDSDNLVAPRDTRVPYFYSVEIFYLMSDSIPSELFFNRFTGMYYPDGKPIYAAGIIPHVGTVLFPDGTTMDPIPHKKGKFSGDLYYYLY